MSQPLTYAQAGVQVELGDAFVEHLKRRVQRPGHSQLPKAAGGYAAVYPFTPQQYLALTTDGVGTKVLLAQEFDCHQTVGIDLVAMCANDLICVGATPTGFLDYYATGQLTLQAGLQIIEGIVAGCDEAGMLLLGGETAEMPDVYTGTHYDLAGFAVGSVTPKQLITGERVVPGQTLIALASTGIHSNGLSLARKVLTKSSDRQALLTPTRLYVKPVLALLQQFGPQVTGLAHITGGGWRNLFRLNPTVGFVCHQLPEVPHVLQQIQQAGVPVEECYKTFNMGMGFAIIAESDAVSGIVSSLQQWGIEATPIGVVNDQPGMLQLEPLRLCIQSVPSNVTESEPSV